MKKIVLTGIFALSVLMATAQQWGIRGGVNITNMSVDAEGMTVSSDSRTGLHFGLFAEFQIFESLYFQPNLLFSQKGYEYDVSLFDSFQSDGYEHFNYLDLPLNLLLKADLKGAKLLVFTGPVISYALNGKYEASITMDGSTEKDRGDIEFGDGDEKYDRAAFAWDLGAGIELGQFQLTGSYFWGLSDITHTESNLKHKGFSVSLAYLFGK